MATIFDTFLVWIVALRSFLISITCARLPLCDLDTRLSFFLAQIPLPKALNNCDLD